MIKLDEYPSILVCMNSKDRCKFFSKFMVKKKGFDKIHQKSFIKINTKLLEVPVV